MWQRRLQKQHHAKKMQSRPRQTTAHLLFLWYRSAEPAMRVANAGLHPGSPLMKRRTSSRKRPFHSPHTSQLGKAPTWYSPPQSHGSASSFTCSTAM